MENFFCIIIDLEVLSVISPSRNFFFFLSFLLVNYELFNTFPACSLESIEQKKNNINIKIVIIAPVSSSVIIFFGSKLACIFI